MSAREEVLKFYRSVVTEDFIRSVQAGLGVSERGGVYCAAVVVWLMIFQRLNADRSLAAAIEEFRNDESGVRDVLVRPTLRSRARKASFSTGAYAQARNRVHQELVDQAADAINSAIAAAHRKTTHKGYRVYLIDGSTLQMAHTKANLEKYPQYENQYGKAHYPLVRVEIATDAITGVALRPSYGPYNGDEATNELALVEEILPRIPQGSVLIGDRYYGCARFASAAKRQGHDVICRVKDRDAKRYIGEPTTLSGEVAACWQARSNESDQVSGRFIWHTLRRRGFRSLHLVLFTTLSLPIDEVVEMYGLRWNVELDLRDVKSTMGLDFVKGKSPQIIAKEIVLGFTAYNLIRHVMAASAKSLKIEPRELSFSRFLKRIRSLGEVVLELGACQRSLAATEQLFMDVGYYKLPRRKTRRPTEPRKIWRRGRVSHMTASREEERRKLKEQFKTIKDPKVITS
jgi:hypothetical protein